MSGLAITKAQARSVSETQAAERKALEKNERVKIITLVCVAALAIIASIAIAHVCPHVGVPLMIITACFLLGLFLFLNIEKKKKSDERVELQDKHNLEELSSIRGTTQEFKTELSQESGNEQYRSVVTNLFEGSVDASSAG